MTSLRNPDIRTRDVRKLVSYKSQFIIWDQGCDETSEWIFASLEDEAHKQKLLAWLSSKNIQPSNESILVGSTWKEPRKVFWSEIMSEPNNYFGKQMFQLYDIDLNWLMEYQVQQIARFGRYSNEKNA